MEHQSGGRAAAPSAAASASQPAATELGPTSSPDAPDPRLSELSRLFIVCGRDRKVDELRALFSTCGAIKHLHLALDRSKKSRGFAFLQYEDPANAAAAIKKLDHMKLEDGHILKVTVAKERPVGGNGKLKRAQHARQDLDDKADGGLREDDGGIDARLPGKRQRSSPPAAALPLGPSRVSPAFLLDKHRLEGFVAAASTTAAKSVKKAAVLTKQLTTAVDVKEESMDPDADQKQVDEVLRDMLAVVEQGAQIKSSDNLFAAYQRVMSTPNRGGKKKRGGNLLVVVPGFKDELEEESSTESLASSIRSVSLAPTPLTIRGSTPDSLWTPRVSTKEGGSMPPPRSKHHLRRRRQSLDGSGSSTEDGSDGSGIRRKRSNTTTTSPPPRMKIQSRGNIPPLSPPRKNSDRSDISLSPDALKAEIISKKLCKRQSSDNAIEESYRVAKHQATRERHNQDSNVIERGPGRPSSAGVDSSYEKHRSIKLEFKSESPEPARTKLFFTSTYKFTEQELEAMFAVYGDFESIELVKSFGRVKTMAYVRYTKSSTAAFVVKSFCEESSLGEENPEKPEFMTLSFAHDTGGHQIHQRAKLANFQADNSLGSGGTNCSLTHEYSSASPRCNFTKWSYPSGQIARQVTVL
ncbi:RRM domain protein [Phytophthora cinnamomi]|uniref:RRM domain protein n=1 Tax=Phytophthora cinnamomi TaxID=4785 RepID=UPI00355957F4|nr:RRM domain protein [Phytophthora cinnamomi]